MEIVLSLERCFSVQHVQPEVEQVLQRTMTDCCTYFQFNEAQKREKAQNVVGKPLRDHVAFGHNVFPRQKEK